MNKKELISQLTSLVEGYTDGLISANNKLFHSGQRLTAEKQEWEQKYHAAMAANKGLEERNESLQVEKQALLDVIFEWKNDNLSLTALNATLSEELQELKERCASQYQDFLKQEQSSQNWQGNYYAMQQSKDSLARELDVAKVKLEEAYKVGNRWFEESKRLTSDCKLLKEGLEKKEKDWSKAIAAAEERHEELDKDLKLCAENCNYVIKENNYLRGEVEQLEKRHEESKKKSHGILATLEENLQKKQEIIEALTVWKEGAESVLDTLEEELKDAIAAGKVHEETIELLVTQKQELSENLHALKQINSFQEHRIEVLARKANKLRKKEQND